MKTLIVYGTKYGCAAQAAEILQGKLAGAVTLADLARQKDPAPEGFDCVVLGGSIYMGRIQKTVQEYAARHLEALLQKKVGLFICAGRPEQDVLAKQMSDAFPAALLEHAAAKEFFGHIYDFSRLNFMDKMIVRKIVGLKESRFALSEAAIESFAFKLSS